jgi:hypothetical protein
MSEWLKEHAWKACVGETLPRVRIPLSPPSTAARSPFRRAMVDRFADTMRSAVAAQAAKVDESLSLRQLRLFCFQPVSCGQDLSRCNATELRPDAPSGHCLTSLRLVTSKGVDLLRLVAARTSARFNEPSLNRPLNASIAALSVSLAWWTPPKPAHASLARVARHRLPPRRRARRWIVGQFQSECINLHTAQAGATPCLDEDFSSFRGRFRPSRRSRRNCSRQTTATVSSKLRERRFSSRPERTRTRSPSGHDPIRWTG